MADGALCGRCRTRPATIAVRHVRRGRPPSVRRLCEQYVREGRLQTRPSPGGGALDRFPSQVASATGDGGASTGDDTPWLDVTRFLSDATGRLLQRATDRAATLGAQHIDTEHLLWSTIQDPPVRRLLQAAAVDIASLGRSLEAEAESGGTRTSGRTRTVALSRVCPRRPGTSC